MKSLFVAISLSLTSLLSLAQVSHDLPDVLSAEAAASVVARGATLVDIRAEADYRTGHIPGAISAPALKQAQDVTSLQQAVSTLGIDLSRRVVLVGAAGDADAQRLQALMVRYATGQVAWLVGGVSEWSLSGRPLVTHAASLLPLPQYLVALNPTSDSPRMAGASRRETPMGMINRTVALAR